MRDAVVRALRPLVLECESVRLEPLRSDHLADLWIAGRDPSIWRWTTHTITSAEEMGAYVSEAVQQAAAGAALPFAIVERRTGAAVGSTRFLNIVPEHRRLEIGATWVGTAWQRTSINTGAKYLLLQHAFEVLGYIRVEFKTHARNERARAALARIGALEEGILRCHMIQPDGSPRDSVYFSVLDREWAGVKRALRQRLGLDLPPAR
jgi:N-acetyltransferase